MNESSNILKFRHPLPKRIWIFGLAALGVAFVSWHKRPTVAVINYAWGAFAFMLGMFAIISLRRWNRRPQQLELTEDGLWNHASDEFIPTAQLDAIITDPRHHDMRVPVSEDRNVGIVYGTKKIIIPQKIAGRREWLQLLAARMKSRDPEVKLQGELLEHYREQLKLHGPDAVHVFKELGANLRLHRPWFTDLMGSVILTLILSALFRSDFVNFGKWEDYAKVPMFVAVILLIAFLEMAAKGRKGVQGAIIVSPSSLAVEHNRVKGVASWAEVGKVDGVGEAQLMKIHLHGSSIIVLNVFDERIKEIYSVILRYLTASRALAKSGAA